MLFLFVHPRKKIKNNYGIYSPKNVFPTLHIANCFVPEKKTKKMNYKFKKKNEKSHKLKNSKKSGVWPESRSRFFGYVTVHCFLLALHAP